MFHWRQFRTIDANGSNQIRIVTNIVMLGSVCAITKVVSKESLRQAITVNMPEKFLTMNLEAFDKGYAIGQQAV